MKLVLCEGRAFLESSSVEKLEQSVTVEISDLSGEVVDGCVTLLPHTEGKSEMLFKIENGSAVISEDMLEIGEKYAIFVCSNQNRMLAGVICIINDPVLGVCILPARGDGEHLWNCFGALVSFVQELRTKLENHINGADII